MYITSHAGYCHNPEEAFSDLKQLLKERTGKKVRRVNRFILLALLGGIECSKKLPSSAAVYLSSGRGDMEITLDILSNIFLDKQPPRPLSFINSVSNAACFYIASELDLDGMSQFVTSKYLAFESALFLAYTDMQQSRCPAALVGAVDGVIPPIETHRARLSLAENTPVAEASHWIQLEADSKNNSPLAKVEACFYYSDSCSEDNGDTLVNYLRSNKLNEKNCVISFGQYTSEATQSILTTKTGLSRHQYSPPPGYFDSMGGYIICDYLKCNVGQQLLYVSAGPDGRSFVLHLSSI